MVVGSNPTWPNFMKKETVTICSKMGDVDAFASVIGFSKVFNTNYYFATLQPDAEFLRKKLRILRPKLKNRWNGFILVDASSKYGMFPFVDRDKVVLVIDHRKKGFITAPRDFPNAKIRVELVGACATLATEDLVRNKIEISSALATLLLSAILLNTIDLSASVTTRRDIKAIKTLKKFNPTENLFNEMLEYKKSKFLKNPKKIILSDFKDKYIYGSLKIGISQLEVLSIENILKKLKMIEKILEEIKKEKKLNVILFNLIEIKSHRSIIFSTSTEISKRIIINSSKIEMLDKNVIKTPVLLRKELEVKLNLSY